MVYVRDDESSLRNLVQSDPDLAYDWLSAQISDEHDWHYQFHSVARTAVSALRDHHRRRLLELMPNEWWYAEMVHDLVRGETFEDLYRMLLESSKDALHLAPLGEKPDPTWCAKAKLALARGYTPEQVARAAYVRQYISLHKEAEHWNAWKDAFNSLRGCPDIALRLVADAGSEYAAEQLASVADRRRNFAGEF